MIVMRNGIISMMVMRMIIIMCNPHNAIYVDSDFQNDSSQLENGKIFEWQIGEEE